MKRWLLLLPLFALFLTGCRMGRYDIVTAPNGDIISNVSRPELDEQNGIYRFKDIRGNENYIRAVRVREIRYSSFSEQDDTASGRKQR